MRILAYAQLLESYRSLTLDSLARSFGVSVDFVDRYEKKPLFSMWWLKFDFGLVNYRGLLLQVVCIVLLTRFMVSSKRTALRSRTPSMNVWSRKEIYWWTLCNDWVRCCIEQRCYYPTRIWCHMGVVLHVVRGSFVGRVRSVLNYIIASDIRRPFLNTTVRVMAKLIYTVLKETLFHTKDMFRYRWRRWELYLYYMLWNPFKRTMTKQASAHERQRKIAGKHA